MSRLTEEVSEFVRHDSCEECGSSDAKSIYSDGHAFCFSCHTYFHSNDQPGLLRPTMSDRAVLRGSAVRLRKRGISAATCERLKLYTDGPTIRFHYYSRDGVLLGAKVRDKDKNFHYEGESDGSFWCQHLYPATGSRVVITEGEFDAASFSEFYPNWAYVSLPTGAAGANIYTPHLTSDFTCVANSKPLSPVLKDCCDSSEKCLPFVKFQFAQCDATVMFKIELFISSCIDTLLI